MDPSARRFGVPGGFSVVWLFGGAVFLAVLAVAGVAGTVPALAGPTIVLAAAALGMVVGASLVLLRRLHTAGATLELEESAGTELELARIEVDVP